jgi:glycosyltransferase involved in cell wall biosynthesis
VLQQTYKNIQFIVVDDCSTDGSVSIINQICSEHPSIALLQLTKNVGNCTAFNRGLLLAKGDFVIDFATDDIMLRDRIEKQVNQFQSLDEQFGVVFSNADYIDEQGVVLFNHTQRLLRKKLIFKIPEGWVFRDVLSRYFISAPTMMIRRSVFAELNGYDENLAYEDFDFWVRSSRKYKYAYLSEVLTHVRISPRSMSSRQYRPGDSQLHSTFLVCEKAIGLCRDDKDRKVLLARIRYEFRQAILSGNKLEAKLFAQLEGRIARLNWHYYFFLIVSWIPLPWPQIRMAYHRIKYG